MILRSATLNPANAQTPPRPAWPVFEETQKGVKLPCLLVPQPAHAVLAGELARRLRTEAFGPLPPDILEAIRLHDTGWEEADGGQVDQLQDGSAGQPLSFLDIDPAVSTLAWRRSIRHAEEISPAAAIIVSRHFCSLARDGEEHHHAFLQEETERRRPLEEHFGAPDDLTRWLGALGFCDLLSLTLCSGHERPVLIPLAHPNMPESKEARKVCVRCHDGKVELSPPVIALDVGILTVEAREHSAAGGSARTVQLSWQVGA